MNGSVIMPKNEKQYARYINSKMIRTSTENHVDGLLL